MTNAEARFNKIHIRKVYACLAVTCHLHFWQNDRDFLRATVVTRGWNGYRNKSQHRKSTLEKKNLPPFQQGFEPATFQSRVRCSNHWAIPARCFPSHKIIYLGSETDSQSMTVVPTLERKLRIPSAASKLLTGRSSTVRELAQFIGQVVSCFEGVKFGPLWYRYTL